MLIDEKTGNEIVIPIKFGNKTVSEVLEELQSVYKIGEKSGKHFIEVSNAVVM